MEEKSIKQTTIKRLILVIIVGVEILVGSLCLFAYKKYIDHQRQIKVAIISEKTIIKDVGSSYKHYWELKPNTIELEQPDWLPYQAKYTYNSDGLNDVDEYPIEKQTSNTYRIITLGDSWTFGHYINSSKNWPELLESKLNNSSFCSGKKIEVINLGMKGFDIPFIVERYLRLGKKYNPDLVIWLENGTGLRRYNERTFDLINECEQKKPQEKVSTGIDVLKRNFHSCWESAETQMVSELTYSKLVSIFTEKLDSFFESVQPNSFYEFILDRAIQNKSQEETIDFWQKRYQANYITNFGDLDSNMFLLDGHPNESGHQFIANHIEQYLKEAEDTLSNCKNE